jgi:hypothetical protein
MTTDAVRDQTKTETRRHVDTWKNLRVGDHLTLVEKAMGLRRGEKQVVLAEVVVIAVDVVTLVNITSAGIRREGFIPAEWTVMRWAQWWAEAHGYEPRNENELSLIKCRRIAWRYLT